MRFFSPSKKEKGIKGYPVAGSLFFTYEGKLVSSIAEETQWKVN